MKVVNIKISKASRGAKIDPRWTPLNYHILTSIMHVYNVHMYRFQKSIVIICPKFSTDRSKFGIWAERLIQFYIS